MGLHARQIALSAGAQGDEIIKLAEQLIHENNIRSIRAAQILLDWRKKTNG